MKVVLAIALVSAGCKADLPELSDAKGGFDARCTTYADLLVDVSPNTLDGTPALEAPDGASVTLETNGVLTVGFVGLGGIVEAPGVDLRFHGAIPAGAMLAVYIAGTDQEFKYSGNLAPTATELDLGQALSVPTAVYVRLVGVSGAVTVDALEAINGMCP